MRWPTRPPLTPGSIPDPQHPILGFIAHFFRLHQTSPKGRASSSRDQADLRCQVSITRVSPRLESLKAHLPCYAPYPLPALSMSTSTGPVAHDHREPCLDLRRLSNVVTIGTSLGQLSRQALHHSFEARNHGDAIALLDQAAHEMRHCRVRRRQRGDARQSVRSQAAHTIVISRLSCGAKMDLGISA